MTERGGAAGGSRVEAFIGLGANVGASAERLAAAVAGLAALPATRLTGVSRLYRTRPVGLVDQADFLNAAVGLRVPVGPSPDEGAMALLVALKELERAFGRVARERWGPRELDLDLLVFGPHRLRVGRPAAARSDDPSRGGPQWLEVPHPEAIGRSFVLAPLADLAPDLVPPGWGMSVREALGRARAVEGEAAVEPVAGWDPAGRRWA